MQNETTNHVQLVTDLREYFNAGHTRSLAWRDQQLAAIDRMLREHEQEFLTALATDLNKSAMEAWMTEVSYVTGDVAHTRKNLKRWMKPRRVSTPMMGLPGKSWIQPEPLGVVLVISAWNYPLQQILSPLVAALSAGNCAILKPSELAPATSGALARLLPEYVDRGCFQVVEGGVAETSDLLTGKFDHILFTGSATVGKIIMSAAAKHLTPVTLELGGKCPCVVLPDASLETAASRIVWGKFLNAGQTCIAPDYILTDAATEARLVPLIEKTITEMFGDDPKQSDSYGRIVNPRHFERVRALMDSGKIAIGGEYDADASYIAPTVLSGVDWDSPVMTEEIFGPVLPIVRSDDLDDSIRTIRSREKPLAAYLFSTERAAETQFLEQLSCGNVCINDVMMFTAVPELPFGGVGASGMGCFKGEHGFKTFSHYKAVMRRGNWPDPDMRYAPFTAKKFKLMRRLR